MPLVDDYQQEMLKQLAVTRSKCVEMINVYRDLEIKSLQGRSVGRKLKEELLWLLLYVA
jgi:hypothetical protein